MPIKFALLVVAGSLLSVTLIAKENRNPRWPLPKSSRSITSSIGFRISEYQNYVKSLNSAELREFAQDAQVSFGTLGVNPERIIVKFRDKETEQAVLQSLTFKEPVREFRSVDAQVLQIPKAANHTELLAHLGALKELEGVEYAHPNYKIRISNVPNDPAFIKQWHYDNNGTNIPEGIGAALADADIDAPEAWKISTGSRDVIVAVLDTGIDYNHEDLIDNLWKNPGETGLDNSGKDKSTNGIDDDGNGYIDDFRGWDFVGNDNDPLDEHGHGTHTAGTIGAVGNNGIGVTGVNWQVSLVPLQIFDSSGSGDLVGAMAALEYATKMKFPITNNSWGGGDYSSAFEELLKQNRDAGSLFVAAAGNNASDNDTTPFYPAGFKVENVISVAATDHKDNLAYFSNFGKNSVHLAAPGHVVYSTHVFGYYYESGTSMACPHVAAAAALIKSVWPSLSYSQIKTKILESVDELFNPSFAGKTMTGGRLNVARAVGGTPSPLPYRLFLQTSGPKVGPLTGGTLINLKGAGFHPNVKVTIGLKPCSSVQVLSQMELTCLTPTSAIAGLHNVIATNPDGTKRILTGAFRYNNPASVTSTWPMAGALAGGNKLTVNGRLFSSGAKVKIGDKDCTQVQLISANQLSCVLPAADAGDYRVIVVNQYGQESSEQVLFSYRPAPQVLSISPLKGLSNKTGTLTVNGSGFLSGASVKIGTQTCNTSTWVSSSTITCSFTALPSGLHSVVITNPEGQLSGNTVKFEVVNPKWVQTNGLSCVSVCSQQGLLSKPSPEGAYCTSGEVVPSSARGVISFTYGCMPNKTCAAQGKVNRAQNQARSCYGPGQIRNNQKTDITVGCFCSLG